MWWLRWLLSGCRWRWADDGRVSDRMRGGNDCIPVRDDVAVETHAGRAVAADDPARASGNDGYHLRMGQAGWLLRLQLRAEGRRRGAR